MPKNKSDLNEASRDLEKLTLGVENSSLMSNKIQHTKVSTHHFYQQKRKLASS